MRRLPRLLLHATAIASILLAATACAIWAISYREQDILFIDVGYGRALNAASGQGLLVVGLVERQSTRRIETMRSIIRWRLPAQNPPGTWHGFQLYHRGWSSNLLTLPTPAAIVLLLGVAAGAWFAARRLRPPTAPTRCRACGYDLRATPARCSECGGATYAVERVEARREEVPD